MRYVAVLALAVIAAGGVAAYLVARPTAGTSRVSIPAGATGVGCGVRGVGDRILSPDGRSLYREPASPMTRFPEIQCSGPTVWAVWVNGVGMSQQAYFGARSLDRGRTWRPVFTEKYFGQKAPHSLDAELGAWTLRGRRDAYFVGSCPACSDRNGQWTTALYVTRNSGESFGKYDVPTLTGYVVSRLAVHGRTVILRAKRVVRGMSPLRKTVTIHVA